MAKDVKQEVQAEDERHESVAKACQKLCEVEGLVASANAEVGWTLSVLRFKR